MAVSQIDNIVDNQIDNIVNPKIELINLIEIDSPIGPVGSLLFDDPAQFLQFPRAGVISITDPAAPFTIEAWIKPTAIKTIASVDGNGNPDPLEYGNIIIGDTEGGGNNWSLQLFNNKLSFYRYNNTLGGFRFFTSNNQIPLNEWTHVAVSYDGSNTLSMFINGVLDASFADYTPPDIQYSVITVGNLFDTGSNVADGGAYAYEGYITNLRINDGQYFYQIVSPFLPTAPLGNIAGTTLRLLANQNDPIKDSGPNNVSVTNVGLVISSSEYPTIYDCADNDAKVLMVGWTVGPRTLTRSSNLLYVYGDETVERVNTSSPWVYKNLGSTISTATSVTEYPWQAEWDNGVTATKICRQWTPSEITTALWYDAADASTITATGSEVTQMLDKSTNNRTLTREGVIPGPNTRTRTLNSLNVLAWTGNNCLDNNSFTYNQAATPLYIAMVLQVDTPAGTQAFFLAGTNSSTAGQRMSARVRTDNSFEVLGGSNTGSNIAMGGGAMTRSQPYITLIKFNSATSAWRVNGTQTNTGNIGTNSFVNIQLGHSELEVFDITGFIAEVVAFADSAQVEKIEGYLAWKWGQQANLPSGHPYKNSPPTVAI